MYQQNLERGSDEHASSVRKFSKPLSSCPTPQPSGGKVKQMQKSKMDQREKNVLSFFFIDEYPSWRHSWSRKYTVSRNMHKWLQDWPGSIWREIAACAFRTASIAALTSCCPTSAGLTWGLTTAFLEWFTLNMSPSQRHKHTQLIMNGKQWNR